MMTEAEGAAVATTEKNVLQTVHDTLWDEMKADDRIVVLGEDVGARGGVFRATAGFLEEFGERRVIDTPLAESAIVGTAIGMALHGLFARGGDPVRRLHPPGVRSDRERGRQDPVSIEQ